VLSRASKSHDTSQTHTAYNPAGFVDAELSRVSKRVQELLTKLPHDINPKGLEELRKVKTALVEAEDRTDTLRYSMVGAHTCTHTSTHTTRIHTSTRSHTQ
jgi:hypothetical protein